MQPLYHPQGHDGAAVRKITLVMAWDPVDAARAQVDGEAAQLPQRAEVRRDEHQLPRRGEAARGPSRVSHGPVATHPMH